MDQSTIVAISTPSGQGALGVIRLSGPGAVSICNAHFSKNLDETLPNQAQFGRFTTQDHSLLDEVVLTLFKAPNSYTGEDIIELSFHGSSFILTEALNALISSGAQMAAPGEFTQRAFFNRKLDLSQAEAVADLIASESAAEHELAMHQMRGGFSAEINSLREELIHFASLIELELDFSEEDVEFANREELTALVLKIQGFIEKLIASFQYGNVIKNGIPVVIIGKPNAGKSTLLNALLNEERAIVTEIAGTTRDAIEDTIVIGGMRFRFVDTAGIRETEDTIEAMGVKKSLEKMQSAAIVLYLFDAREPADEHTEMISDLKDQLPAKAKFIAVANKIDLVAGQYDQQTLADTPVISISAKQKENLQPLLDGLIEIVHGLNSNPDHAIVTNTRHLQALKATTQALENGLSAIRGGLSGDLVAADIRQALHHLGSITGEISTDDLLGNIFGKFCIGK